MVRAEKITKGMEIQTELGMIKVLWLHTSNTVMCEQYEYNADTDQEELVNDRALFTYSEIEREMKNVDGRNHKVIFE